MKWSVITSGIAATVFASGLAAAAVPTVHEGYPYNGKGADEYGKPAEVKATQAVNQEFMSGGYAKKMKAAEDQTRHGIKATPGDPRHPQHPGYPYR